MQYTLFLNTVKVMNKNAIYAELLIRIGALFAQCDGMVDAKEKQFIADFTSKLLQENIIDEEISEQLTSSAEQSISFYAIVKEMKDFLAPFNELERSKLIDTTNEFIQKLIAADNVIAPEEQSLYEKWSNAFQN